MISFLIRSCWSTSACFCSGEFMNNCSNEKCQVNVTSTSSNALILPDQISTLYLYSDDYNATYNIPSTKVNELEIINEIESPINIYVKLASAPTCGKITTKGNVTVKYGGRLYYPFTATPVVPADQIYFESIVLTKDATLDIRDDEFDVTVSGEKNTPRINKDTGLTISINTGITKINGQGGTINKISSKGTAVVSGISMISILNMDEGSTTVFQSKSTIELLELSVGLKSTTQAQIDFKNNNANIQRIKLFPGPYSDSLFIDSYKIFQNSENVVFNEIEKEFRYTVDQIQFHSALMILSKDGMVSFLVSVNAVLDKSLQKHTSKEINGETYYAAESVEDLANTFYIQSLAFYQEIEDYSKIRFAVTDKRTVINGLGKQVTLTIPKTSTVTTVGDINLIGSVSYLHVLSGVTIYNNNTYSLDVFPGGTLKAQSGFTTSRVTLYFNPTGCGLIEYDNTPTKTININLEKDEINKASGTSLEYTFIKNADNAFKATLKSQSVAYNGFKYNAKISGTKIILEKDSTPVKTVCFGLVDECPEGIPKVDSLDGFSDLSEVIVSNDAKVPLSAMSNRFHINAKTSCNINLVGEDTGKTIVVSGTVSLSGKIDSIEVNSEADVTTDQISLKSAIVRYDGRDNTQLLFKNIPTIQDKITLVKGESSLGYRGSKFVVGVNGDHSENELGQLRSKISMKVIYSSNGIVSGFKPDYEYQGDKPNFGLMIGIIIAVVILVAAIGFGIFYFIRKRNSRTRGFSYVLN